MEIFSENGCEECTHKKVCTIFMEANTILSKFLNYWVSKIESKDFNSITEAREFEESIRKKSLDIFGSHCRNHSDFKIESAGLSASESDDTYINRVDNLATDRWGGAGPDCCTGQG